MRKINIIILIFFLYGCWQSIYKITIENTEDLKITIIKTEELIKKVEVLDIYKKLDYKYPIFKFKDDGITMINTMVNYDPNDSIKENRRNPNLQEHIDTCRVISGLNENEWIDLKKNLRKLEDFGIKGNNIAYYNDAKFEFFYYDYIYPTGWERKDIGYIALLSDKIVNEEDFKQRFVIMDQKDGIYLIKKI